jgi:BirA family transcriptional regulator, biotin operon repressor / biotin---[acetyl-CoA-carboxylase] ligase
LNWNLSGKTDKGRRQKAEGKNRKTKDEKKKAKTKNKNEKQERKARTKSQNEKPERKARTKTRTRWVTVEATRNYSMQLQIRTYGCVTSTMDVALAAVDEGAAEGLVIVADEQTAGRGRRGRVWSSPAGAGLYMSFVLRPGVHTLPAGALSLLPLAAAVAVRGAIMRTTGVTAHLKWPNDLLVGQRKLAGILAEGLDVGSPAQTVIVGIGINVTSASHPDDVAVRATSIEAESGRPVDRSLLQQHVVHAVDGAYESLRLGRADEMLRAWREAAPSAEGATVEWWTASGTQRGTTAGIDTAGALLVRTDHAVERVVGGELLWL